MKLLYQAFLNSYRRRKDKSVSITFITQELTSEEVMQIDKSLDTFGVLFFTDSEIELNDIHNIEEEKQSIKDVTPNKSQSQKIRNALFGLYERSDKTLSWNDFYKLKTDQIIEHIKQL